jgi:phospholipase/lecithinase/hemolysin
VGTFDTTLYDLERQIMEQSRTNIERFGRQNMDMLQQNLGSRFGISGASGSLAAGASAELAGKMNEQYIGAQQQVTSQMLGLQQAREAALAGIIMPMMGLDPSAVSWASANANQALQGSAQVGAQLAAQAAQRKQALWGSLLGLGQAFGAGAFGDLFSGGASYPIVGSTVPGTPPSYYNNPLNP